MRDRLRALALLLVALLVGVVVVSGFSAAAADDPAAEVTPTPTPTPTEVPSTAFEVDDALLRWGINNETNNRGAAPSTFNFLSAGKVGNPGEGGQLIADASAGATWANGRAAGWKASEGNVRIEKLRGDSYGLATWAGLKTDRDGTTLGGYAVNTRFSDHQVVLSGGTGTVDPASGEALIAWDGDFTVVYYSGYTFFYVSDPVLTVTHGIGKVTATMNGYSSDMENLAHWAPVPTKKDVVIADLGPVDLDEELGFTAKPKYLGVKVTGVDQVTAGEYFGSFPQSFMNFLKTVGIAAYFHSSGGSIDKNKVPLELAVSYAAGDPIIPETEDPDETADPVVENSAPPPPVVQQPGPVLPPQPTAPVAVPAASPAPALVAVRPVATILPAVLPLSAGPEGSGSAGPWYAGVALLALAALAAAAPRVYERVTP